jgi:hypothetical protein
MLNEEISNISNLSWMKRIDNYFILLIGVGDMGKIAAGNDTETLVSEKTNIDFKLLQILVT